MNKKKKILIIALLFLMISSCKEQVSEELPTPHVLISSAPEVDSAVESFLSLWKNGEHAQMYQMLSSLSKQEISSEEFVQFYEQTSFNAALQSIETQLISSMKNPGSAAAKYKVVYNTALFGSFEREIEMVLTLEENNWKVNWNSGLIMPELAGGNRLQLETINAERGSIYASDGQPVVSEDTAYALAIIPNQIEDGKEGVLLSYLSELTGRTPESIQASYEDIRRTNWAVPVGEVSADEIANRWDALIALGGIQISEFKSRYYYSGGIASQAVGYLSTMSPEQVDEYRDLGYLGDEQIGQAGIEKYAEQSLAGKPAASLYVVNEANQIVSIINQADAKLPQDITTTFDKNLQIEAQNALLGFNGAIVVMEVETGRILAMASSPNYDPNLFTAENSNSAEQLDELLNDGKQRLLNRVTQGAYPAGSVFKIIGMAAALESDLYTPDTTYFCGSYFEELPGERFKDWTVDKELPPSGTLTLVEGLTRSCNPWFYHIGLDLFRQKGADYLSEFARGFGLGSATGIDQVAEVTGQIVDPASDGDAVQQGIGQGDMLVTPLQVVRFTAALANGGTLYRPQIIERITSSNGVDVYTFSPLAQSELPVSQETLDAINEGMRAVVKSSLGTAREELGDLTIPLYGKTGTAENPLGDSHAWFTGYSSAGREDKPDIAVTVIVENGGEGSAVGAPVFRRVIETYYYGEPLKLYPWEAKFNVTRTPTPEFTQTPLPGASSAPAASGDAAPEQEIITPTPSG
jgi:penicillin-binding protein 2